MKKVLIISTSPRKGGNSEILAEEFGKGALEKGNSAEKIFLYDKTIGFCNGCLSCQTTKLCIILLSMSDTLSLIASLTLRPAEYIRMAMVLFDILYCQCKRKSAFAGKRDKTSGGPEIGTLSSGCQPMELHFNDHFVHGVLISHAFAAIAGLRKLYSLDCRAVGVDVREGKIIPLFFRMAV